MLLRGLIDEDFVNYKKCSMFLAFPFCDYKCEKEAGCNCCQNRKSKYDEQPIINISIEKLIDRYMKNEISKSVVCGGFEPMLSFDELVEFIGEFRKVCDDDIVIYTGYYKDEICDKIEKIKEVGGKNIIVKFGRYDPSKIDSHLDNILGVKLASSNQYAEVL